MIRKLRADEIECRPKSISEKGCTILLYKTARVDRAILDEHFNGIWQNDFKVVDGKMYGGIGIYNKELKEWLWRWDCGTESQTEKEKGEASDCFKRAGFKWGIGIELYTAPFIFAYVNTIKDGTKYKLANSFQKFYVKEIDYSETGAINNLVIVDDNSNEVFSTKKNKDRTKRKDEESSKTNDLTNSDIDIIANIETFNDLVNLTRYFKENQKKVKDIEAFTTACSRRKVFIQNKNK